MIAIWKVVTVLHKPTINGREHQREGNLRSGIILSMWRNGHTCRNGINTLLRLVNFND